MQHNSLKNYYDVVFALQQKYGYRITEIENMMPWERDVYLALIEKENNKTEEKIEW